MKYFHHLLIATAFLASIAFAATATAHDQDGSGGMSMEGGGMMMGNDMGMMSQMQDMMEGCNTMMKSMSQEDTTDSDS